MRQAIAWSVYAAALFCAAISLSSAAPRTPSAAAGKRTAEVMIDGVLDDAAWRPVPWQTGFVSASEAPANAGAPKPAAAQTRFKVLHDASAIYVAVECDEPQIEKLKARHAAHDNEVYQDDCVELFMDPAGDGRYYHHFIVNSRGAWYDDYGADYGLVQAKRWDCPLRAAGSVDAAARVWRCEVRIPLAGLQLKPDAGSTWLWNVTRERQVTGATELSTWAPLKGSFHQPRLFGKLTGVAIDYGRFAVVLGEPKVTVAGGTGSTHGLELRVPVTNGTRKTRRFVLAAERFLTPLSAVKTSTVTVAAGATQSVRLPALMLPRDETDAAIQVSALDADTGEPVKIVVKRLDAEYRPIAVYLLQPVYRGNIYATETVPQIVFRVSLASEVARTSTKVVCTLLNTSGRPAVSPIAAAPTQLARALRLPARSLPVGRYSMRVQALDKAGKAVAETALTIRKLAKAPGCEVRIDRQGNIVVDGKPRVFCGWYGDVPTEDPRPDVVALQDLQTPVVIGPKSEEVAGVRRRFAERGIYSIVSIEPGRLHYAFELWRKPGNTVADEIKKLSEPSAECVGYLKLLVEAVRREPGVLGYYLADEPEINDARSDYLEAVYKVMQDLDPYRPVIITNDTLDGIVTHGYRACDILSPDPYSPAWEYVPNFLKRCHEVLRRGQGIMLTPWTASSDAHFNVEFGQTPPYPYAVMRHQHLTALAMNCKGFAGYTTPFFMPEPRLRYGLPPIWKEVRFLEPALASPAAAPRVTADAEMIAWAGRAHGHVTLIVSNIKAGSRDAVVRHPLLRTVRSLFVVSEGRAVAVRGDSFGDRFAEGAVHVYTTDPAGRHLPTAAEVEAEIKAREAACAKPGNLLHWSRGVRARSDEGFYAPWFSQYYYYAINGVTDDDGWFLSHTDKPARLELTLPREEKIGRVAIWTPNLKDYDLEFQAADGSIQVAEVRGNRSQVSEQRFAVPAPTLKLRVLALATAEANNPGKAKVREIEAYTDGGACPFTPLRLQAPVGQAPEFAPAPDEAGAASELWREDFSRFAPAAQFKWDGKDDQWVLDPSRLGVAPKAGGGAVVKCTSVEGYASMSRFFPYDTAFRYLQIRIGGIAGDGYRWLAGGFGDSSGKPGFRGGVHASRPGVYTVDTHYVNPIFRDNLTKRCFLTVSTAGSTKRADGSVQPGPAFTVDWLRLIRTPRDGLAVTMAGGGPLPEALKQGDEVVFRLFLEQPALDATVEVNGGSNYTPIPINGRNSLQLVRVGAKDGREWAAQVKLGAGTGTFDGTAGYPVIFRAVITGGTLKDTYGTATVKFE